MLRSLALLSACSVPLAAQASFTTFGAGCALQGQTLSIGHQGLPRVGMSFGISYSGPNFAFNSAQQSAAPILVLGNGTAGFTIPTTLLPFQPAGCMGLITPDALIAAPLAPSGASYASSVPFSVPNNAALVGATFHAQWMTLFTQCGFVGCNLGAVVTSDAATCVVGP